MLTLLEQIDKGTLWHSPGGIHPPQLKTLSNTQAVRQLPLAAQYRVPLPQVGDCARLTVKVGEQVLKGQMLTDGEGFMYLPVHAPTSGQIISIEQHASNHASGLPCLTCTIAADGQDTAAVFLPATLTELSNQQVIEKIKQAGIAGMGGATFPSHIKLNPASEIDLVIINGVECEPYITSDDVLMREYATDIIKGIEVIDYLLKPQRIIIAIEDNKSQAAATMKTALAGFESLAKMTRITIIPTKYPSGGEKQLIQIVTGKEIHTGSIPAQQGIVVHNVGTAFAIQDAVLNGKPLIERLVTITGNQVSQPGNYWLPIGTPITHALKQTQTPVKDTNNISAKVIIGGPMMGYALPNTDVPVLKGTNCILVPSSDEIAPDVDEKACIRCGECAVVCPALLLPQQLFWHAKAQEYDKAASFNLKDCIECGCCSYVCPSDIPLVEYYRIAKSALKNEAEEKFQAEQAKIRFEARLQRLEDEKRAREEKSRLAAEKRKAAMDSSKKDAVAEAMARIAAKKQATATPAAETNNNSATTDKSAAVKAAIARAKAKKLASAVPADANDTPVTTSTVTTSSEPSNTATDKKSQIAAAVARAKAKKLAATSATDDVSASVQAANEQVVSEVTEVTSEAVDDRKAKIAATVARAKAKKLAATAATSATDDISASVQVANEQVVSEQVVSEVTEVTSEPIDDRKAKIAAAVARAKAKKLAATAATSATDDISASVQVANEQVVSEVTEVTSKPIDDKKAKIAAAVARAKAKKLAATNATDDVSASVQATNEQAANEQVVSEVTKVQSEPVDDKKAKIAAAVAKAKAKKLAPKHDAENETVSAPAKLKEEPAPTEATDDKKARIAAAVAKAKAKKLENQRKLSEKE
ncbi:electron transport complex subunit RsxC [Shewanella sp. 10N.286.51.B8]|uniref:electron transport complex subunit RsxC n=1 Tax=Shewanella sp. 10N.286.51.B8 TaxID=3229708 RepID=UPI0035521543